LTGKRAFSARLHAICVENMLRLFGYVQQFGNAVLHAEAEFIRLDDAVDGVGRSGTGGKLMIETLNVIQLLALECFIGGSLEVGQVALVGDPGR
jgi:hypothetical protein